MGFATSTETREPVVLFIDTEGRLLTMAKRVWLTPVHVGVMLPYTYEKRFTRVQL